MAFPDFYSKACALGKLNSYCAMGGAQQSYKSDLPGCLGRSSTLSSCGQTRILTPPRLTPTPTRDSRDDSPSNASAGSAGSLNGGGGAGNAQVTHSRARGTQYLAPNCLLITYYQGDIERMIEEHFGDSLGIKSSDNAEGDSGPPAAKKPRLSRRSLPASFWDERAAFQRRQYRGVRASCSKEASAQRRGGYPGGIYPRYGGPGAMAGAPDCSLGGGMVAAGTSGTAGSLFPFQAPATLRDAAADLWHSAAAYPPYTTPTWPAAQQYARAMHEFAHLGNLSSSFQNASCAASHGAFNSLFMPKTPAPSHTFGSGYDFAAAHKGYSSASAAAAAAAWDLHYRGTGAAGGSMSGAVSTGSGMEAAAFSPAVFPGTMPKFSGF